MSKNIRILIFFPSLLLLCALGCTHVPKSTDSTLVEEPRQRLFRLSFQQNHLQPVPVLIEETETNLQLSAGRVELVLVRRWDVNQDGKAEMTELWSKNGRLIARAVDFDGDAMPDKVIEPE